MAELLGRLSSTREPAEQIEDFIKCAPRENSEEESVCDRTPDYFQRKNRTWAKFPRE